MHFRSVCACARVRESSCHCLLSQGAGPAFGRLFPPTNLFCPAGVVGGHLLGCTRPSSLGLMYYIYLGIATSIKGWKRLWLSVPVKQTSHSLSMVQVLESWHCHLMSDLPYSKAKQLPQVAYILADIWWGLEGTSTWRTKVETCHQGDLKSICVAFWGLGIEPTAPAFARQALYHRTLSPAFSYSFVFLNFIFIYFEMGFHYEVLAVLELDI